MLSLHVATSWTLYLLLFLLCLNTIEFYFLGAQKTFINIWSYKNLSPTLEEGLPFPSSLVQKLFSDSNIKTVLVLEFFTIVFTAIYPNAILLGILFLFHLYLCVRFQGSFNGGSDMMTFVLITGVTICQLGFPKEGLIYISVHTLYSYFKAGAVKAIHKEWWNGTAIPIFLGRSVVPCMRILSKFLFDQKIIAQILGLSTLAFELFALVLIFLPNLRWLYFGCAIIFHLSIFYCFGLNRFFWAWLTAWPATLFSLSLIGGK